MSARSLRGRLSKPAKRTTTMRKTRKTAKYSSPRRLMGDSLRGTQDRDIARVQRDSHSGGERLALAFTNGKKTPATFFLELPAVETGALRLAIAEHAHLFTQAVEPVFVIELEVIGGVLVLVHLSEVVLGEAEVFESEMKAVEEGAYFDFIFFAHFKGDAAI